MSGEAGAMREAYQSRAVAPAARSWIQPFYWSVRRELWENRSIYLAPLAVAAAFLIGFVINMFGVRHHLHNMWPFGADEQHNLLTTRYEIAAALIMVTAFVVGVFYSLDALYGERRDRSILFWKSLPISDLTAVISKFLIPIFVLPLVSLVIAIATQFVMLLLSTIILAGSGVNIAALWREASFFRVSLTFLYHLFTVHGLWYAPMYGWLIMISAWARRAPFIWAFLPPFVIGGVEKVAFNTSHFFDFLLYRLSGPPTHMSMGANAHSDLATDVSTLIPHHFFAEPGLWIGLLIAAIFLAIAVRLRRYHGPI
jgi:ABC-2 type transport system permease protein